MINPMQHRGWFSWRYLRAANGTLLALVVVLGLVVVTTPPVQAQSHTTYRLLHTFTGTPDGQYPFAGLIRDTAGDLYGTTVNGGAIGGGTVFKLDTEGLARDAAGNLYGTTFNAGAFGQGTVFKLDTTGTETVQMLLVSTDSHIIGCL
jgi:uncharacterized repeat protein (TIGR03803 family)